MSDDPDDIDDAVRRLEELAEIGGPEYAHVKADEILLEFVPEEVADAYESVPKWYA